MLSTVPLKSSPGLDRPVREVMRAGVVSLPADAPLALAARAMADHDVHAVLVIDEKPLGWITARGMLHSHLGEWAGARARDAVTEPPATIRPTATLREAIDVCIGANVSHVLVTEAEGGPAFGVLADSDLVRHLGGTTEGAAS